MRGRRHLGLTGRVVAVLTVAAIAPTVVVGFLAFYRSRTDFEYEVIRSHLALIRATGAFFDGTLQGARRSLELAASAWADQRTPDTVQRDARASQRLLHRLRSEVPIFSRLAIVDIDGRRLFGDALGVPLQASVQGAGGYVGDVVFLDGTPRVVVVAEARSRTGERVGAFIAELDLRFISEALERLRLGPSARVTVVDGDGVVVAHSERLPAIGDRGAGVGPAVAVALGSATEGVVEIEDRIVAYRNLLSYQGLRGLHWVIIVEQPVAEVYAPAYQTRRDTIIVGAAALAAALIFGVVLATHLTGPLRRLSGHADALAIGDGDPDGIDWPTDAPGEIGVLAQRFAEMARRIGEREQLREALAREQRLSTIGTMAASVAHEINNPLTTVLGYAKLLAEDKQQGHPDLPGLALIAGEADRMKAIIGGLLDYSRSDRAPQPGGPTDVNAIVQRTAVLLQPTLRRAKVGLSFELDEELPRGLAGSYELQQIFVNLAQNACQAMPDGGTLTVTSLLAGEPGFIEVSFTDTGPGIPPGFAERIFDPFFTTKEAGHGTGLGLAVCRHLVTGFGGRIEVDDSRKEAGSCFRVMIPIAR